MWFRSWFGSLNRQSSCKTTRRAKRAAHRGRESRRLFLESLEDRLTPSLTWAGDFPVAESPMALVTGDFNNDGHLDLATGNQDATVNVLLGAGDGGFGTAIPS